LGLPVTEHVSVTLLPDTIALLAGAVNDCVGAAARATVGTTNPSTANTTAMMMMSLEQMEDSFGLDFNVKAQREREEAELTALLQRYLLWPHDGDAAGRYDLLVTMMDKLGKCLALPWMAPAADRTDRLFFLYYFVEHMTDDGGDFERSLDVFLPVLNCVPPGFRSGCTFELVSTHMSSLSQLAEQQSLSRLKTILWMIAEAAVPGMTENEIRYLYHGLDLKTQHAFRRKHRREQIVWGTLSIMVLMRAAP